MRLVLGDIKWLTDNLHSFDKTGLTGLDKQTEVVVMVTNGIQTIELPVVEVTMDKKLVIKCELPLVVKPKKEKLMANMTARDVAAAVIVAALQFRQKYDADLEAQSGDRALMSEEQQQASLDSVIPEEQDESDWWEQFSDFIERAGLTKMLQAADSNIKTIAGLNKKEPAFTLRGQDILASPLVRHWSELASLNPDVPARKLDHADRIAEQMEEYHPQKWPD